MFYQEAHAMVLEANIKQSNAEKKFEETNSKVRYIQHHLNINILNVPYSSNWKQVGILDTTWIQMFYLAYETQGVNSIILKSLFKKECQFTKKI